MGSWYRVAVGAEMVARALAQQKTSTAARHSWRLGEHIVDLSSVLTNAARSQTIDHSHQDDDGAEFSSGSSSSVVDTLKNMSTTNQTITQPVSKPKLSKEHDNTSESTQDPSVQLAQENQIRPNPVDGVPESDEGNAPTNSRLQEGRAVPSTRLGRAFGFAQLGAGLLVGTAAEGFSRILGTTTKSGSLQSMVVNDANADRLAMSLCRMRGAALKMGQMLSIQDESLLPPELSRALEQVRQGADAMPHHQLVLQLEDQLGSDWESRFYSFDQRPFAAASIGQVHRASILLPDSSSGLQEIKDVVVKIQYPGVARSIESDLGNLSMLVKMTGLAPQGLFLDNIIRVGQQELKVECDYLRELQMQRRMRELVESDERLVANRFIVPEVYEDLSTDQVLVTEFQAGGTIDKAANLDQEERNRVGETILFLTMKELFEWRLMQTDPNWGNFLYDVNTRTTGLIDFGATREYPKEFVDGYLRIVWAAANRDADTLMEQSHRMHFLTGEENAEMLNAHKMSGFTVGEPFQEGASNQPFDFRGSNISTRMGGHTSVFLRHRLTAPPEEVYTLHRKLAGAYMLCIKLGSLVNARDMLQEFVAKHDFEDGLPHPMS